MNHPEQPATRIATASFVTIARLLHPVKVLLIKPYSPTPTEAESPPLGLLCLSAHLKQTLGSDVQVRVQDMRLYRQEPSAVIEELKHYQPDIVGVSALNCEAGASRKIAELVKTCCPGAIAVLGGPYAHKRGAEILANSVFDWVISGPGDRVFTEVVLRYVNGLEFGGDIPGLTYRKADGSLHCSGQEDFIEDLDSLPIPDWQQIDFDLYARRKTMMNMIKGRRYALLFTSRGCPYLCNYCHDIFTKKFKYQSPERVIAEIEYLYTTFGIDEFQIVDDIFNLHKPRVKKIMQEVNRRWPGKIFFCFPNGLRADILDDDVIYDLKIGGTYAMAIAIETATPRLQELSDKHLDVDKVFDVISRVDSEGILTAVFFMIGFPTETRQEMQATVDFAKRSKLTMASFFNVIPQPGTPLYQLAEQENKEALEITSNANEDGTLSYMGSSEAGTAPWYELAYGFPLRKFQYQVALQFQFKPSRLVRLLWLTPKKNIPMKIVSLFRYVMGVPLSILKG